MCSSVKYRVRSMLSMRGGPMFWHFFPSLCCVFQIYFEQYWGKTNHLFQLRKEYWTEGHFYCRRLTEQLIYRFEIFSSLVIKQCLNVAGLSYIHVPLLHRESWMYSAHEPSFSHYFISRSSHRTNSCSFSLYSQISHWT